MKSETKLFLGIIIGTIAIVAAGIFLLSKPAGGNKVDSSLLVRADSHKIATGSGAVTLVEFSDFQCPACGAYHPVVKKIIEEFKADLTFVYRNFPLTTLHKNAQLAAAAAEAAGKQEKYWEMSDLLFEKQKEWSDADNARDIFAGYAKTLGLNVATFTKDIDAGDVKDKISQDIADGNALGISGTPTFYVNAEKIVNPANFAAFEAIIQAAIEKAPKPTSGEEAVHTHFNLAVYLNGSRFDFSLTKYQETNEFIHFHDGKGDLVHIHKANVTLGELFNSLGMSFAGAKMYVNGKENSMFMEYAPQDLDQILITDGAIIPVADDACIYSEKCPERGTPPPEECVGGLGTDCED